MMKNIFFTFLLYISFSIISYSQPIEIDFLNQRINNTHFTDLTIDSLANALGRPTAVNSNELIKDLAGPSIYYHELGLGFSFNSKSKDPHQKCNSVVVYLTKTWDDDYQTFFMPFPDRILPEVDANKRVDDVSALLGSEAELVTPEQRRKELESLKGIVSPNLPVYYYLNVKQTNGATVFMFEEVTKFLEKVAMHGE